MIVAKKDAKSSKSINGCMHSIVSLLTLQLTLVDYFGRFSSSVLGEYTLRHDCGLQIAHIYKFKMYVDHATLHTRLSFPSLLPPITFSLHIES